MRKRLRLSRRKRLKYLPKYANRKALFIKIAVLSLAFIIILFASLAYGKYLGEKAEDSAKDTTVPKETDSRISIPIDLIAVPEVSAFPLSSDKYKDSTLLSSAISELDKYAPNEISLFMKEKNKVPAYATAITAPEFAATDGLSAKDIFSSVEAANKRSCAIFEISFFSEDNTGLKEVKKAYEMALIKELHESGADEILLCGIDPHAVTMSNITAFAKEIKSACSGTPIGIIIPESFPLSKDGGSGMVLLSESFDLTLLDISASVESDIEKNGGRENILSLIAPSIPDDSSGTDSTAPTDSAAEDIPSAPSAEISFNKTSEDLDKLLITLSRYNCRIYAENIPLPIVQSCLLPIYNDFSITNYQLAER